MPLDKIDKYMIKNIPFITCFKILFAKKVHWNLSKKVVGHQSSVCFQVKIKHSTFI